MSILSPSHAECRMPISGVDGGDGGASSRVPLNITG
jgi:hypothetical protein